MSSENAEYVLTVGSLFSGIGGVDMGFERAGMRVAWQCEIDPAARRVLARHWPTVPCYDDVKEIHGKRTHEPQSAHGRPRADIDGEFIAEPGRERGSDDPAHHAGGECPGCLPRVDVLCGGFPCQDLSVAGRRAGLGGERSGLFHEFMRVADELAPRWVLIENVPGLLSSNDGQDMGVVLGVLADLGYGWCYRVLDAQYFGVAQRRRRVFIVGCAGDRRAGQVLLEPESCDGNPPPRRGKEKVVAALIADGVGTCGADDNQGQAGHLIPATAHCLTAQDKAGYRHDPTTDTLLPVAFHQTQEPIVAHDFSSALGATSIGMGVMAFSENQRGEVLETEYSRQLTTGGGKPGQGYPAVRDGMAVRRLMPIECERLQGFPDGHTDSETDSARYRLLGNAVCVPVAHWIGERIVAADRGTLAVVGASHMDGSVSGS